MLIVDSSIHNKFLFILTCFKLRSNSAHCKFWLTADSTSAFIFDLLLLFYVCNYFWNRRRRTWTKKGSKVLSISMRQYYVANEFRLLFTFTQLYPRYLSPINPIITLVIFRCQIVSPVLYGRSFCPFSLFFFSLVSSKEKRRNINTKYWNWIFIPLSFVVIVNFVAFIFNLQRVFIWPNMSVLLSKSKWAARTPIS